MLEYFGDEPERWTGWKERGPIIEKRRPEFMKALQDYRTASKIFYLVLKSLEPDQPADQEAGSDS